MTNEEIRTAMWEAYMKGISREAGKEVYPLSIDREYFNEWLEEVFPELLEEPKEQSNYIPVRGPDGEYVMI